MVNMSGMDVTMHKIHPVIQHAVDSVPAIQGVSMLTTAIASAVSLALGAGLMAWYKSRGLAGMQIDLNNVKTDVENLKTKFSPDPATPVA